MVFIQSIYSLISLNFGLPTQIIGGICAFICYLLTKRRSRAGSTKREWWRYDGDNSYAPSYSAAPNSETDSYEESWNATGNTASGAKASDGYLKVIHSVTVVSFGDFDWALQNPRYY